MVVQERPVPAYCSSGTVALNSKCGVGVGTNRPLQDLDFRRSRGASDVSEKAPLRQQSLCSESACVSEVKTAGGGFLLALFKMFGSRTLHQPNQAPETKAKAAVKIQPAKTPKTERIYQCTFTLGFLQWFTLKHSSFTI